MWAYDAYLLHASEGFNQIMMQNASERLIKRDSSNPVSKSNSPEVHRTVIWI